MIRSEAPPQSGKRGQDNDTTESMRRRTPWATCVLRSILRHLHKSAPTLDQTSSVNSRISIYCPDLTLGFSNTQNQERGLSLAADAFFRGTTGARLSAPVEC